MRLAERDLQWARCEVEQAIVEILGEELLGASRQQPAHFAATIAFARHRPGWAELHGFPKARAKGGKARANLKLRSADYAALGSAAGYNSPMNTTLFRVSSVALVTAIVVSTGCT